MAMIYKLPIWDTVAGAWNRVYGAKATLWAAYGMIVLIALGFSIVQGIIGYIVPPVKPLVGLIFQLVMILLEFGVLYMGILRAQDKPINYRLVFRNFQWNLALYILGFYLLLILIILPFAAVTIVATMFLHGILGFIIDLLVGVGFLYLMVRLWLSLCFIVDKVVNPIDAIKLSFAATRENFWNLAGLMILVWLILVVSAIPLGIGLIWSLPFSVICIGLAYKNLSVNV